MLMTRQAHPELAIGVHFLCRVVAGPSEEAWKCALYLLHYAYENRHVGIVLTKKEGAQLNAFVDASNKGDHDDNGRVAMGHVVYLGNSPIDWRCTKTPAGSCSRLNTPSTWAAGR